MTGSDLDRVVAGAPVLWPATSAGDGLLHLARAEARRKSAPVLLGVCPELRDVPLVASPRRRWWHRRPRWCERCKSYRDYLAGLGQL